MFNRKEITITPENFKDFDFNSLIGKHIKFRDTGWTKVYSIKILRIPHDEREIVLSINEGVCPGYGIAVNYLTEGNPTFCVKEHRWWPW